MEFRTVVNCDALELLERVKDGVATLAYFDPPAGVSAAEAELHELRTLYLHAAYHGRRVLCDRGVLVWHTVPEVSSDVRRCLDRVFGSRFLATEIVLQRPLRARFQVAPTTDHTSLLVYSKTGDFCYASPTRPLSDDKRNRFSHSDEKGSYKLDDLTTGLNRPSLQFAWCGYEPPAGRSWRYARPELEERLAAGLILTPESSPPRQKVYLDESACEEIGSVWGDIDLPTAERARGASAGQQSLKLMARVISMFTRKGDLVVDPFCGSGTTLVAAENLARLWLGADCSQGCCEQTVARLKSLRGDDFAFFAQNHLSQFPVECNPTQLLRRLPPPTGSEIHDLITSHESKILEFKQTFSVDVKSGTKESYIELASLKTIAGFLNTEGGTLLVGVTDDGRPVGVDDEIKTFHKDSIDKFLLHFKNLVRSNIGEAFYPLIDFGVTPISSRQILWVRCKPSDRPCFIGDDFYVRTNPATDKLTGAKVIEYVAQRFRNEVSDRSAKRD